MVAGTVDPTCSSGHPVGTGGLAWEGFDTFGIMVSSTDPNVTFAVVPEPATLSLLAAMPFRRRR